MTAYDKCAVRTTIAVKVKKQILVTNGKADNASSKLPAATAKRTADKADRRGAKKTADINRNGNPTPRNFGNNSSAAPPKTRTKKAKTIWTTSFFTANEDVLQRRKINGRQHFTFTRRILLPRVA